MHADAIGLMIAEPDCEGDCTVEMTYGVTTEAWVCRFLSGFVALGLVALCLSRNTRYFRKSS